MAALATSGSGGLIPQARHGGNGVRAFAVVGSKLEGSGFEKEHIGHTQVAVGWGTGTGEARPSELEGEVRWAWGGGVRDSCLVGLG